MARTSDGVVPLIDRIEETGAGIREPLRLLIEAIGGTPPRPTRLIRSVGLDKSLASRLVRALRADSDLEFMHLVPAPTGLRIFSDRARSVAEGARILQLEAAIDRFQELVDGTPGGRAAIDALISESSHDVREKREHVAKQASFKSMSFILGHFCESLTTSIFLVPSRSGKAVDAIEVHRRIGLRRMRPSTPLALLSILTPPDEEPTDDSVWIESLEGGLGLANPADFLLSEFSSAPLPELEVLANHAMTTFMLAGDPSLRTPGHLTSAFRVRNGWPRRAPAGRMPLRGYVLHTPCRTLVRDVFVAEDLYGGAIPRVDFRLPSPGGYDDGADGDRRDPGLIDLTAPIEQLPTGVRAYEIPGVGGNRPAIQHVLERAGHADTKFRGWRCAITYPVALIEMMWWLTTAENGD
jgi:hypothetical protein